MGRPGTSGKPRMIDQQKRVALPAEVLAALGLDAGDYVVFEVDGNRVSVHKVKWTVDSARTR